MLVRATVIAVWSAAWLSAANPAAVPQLQSSYPLSVTRGETSELVVRGSNLESATGVLFDCAEIEAEVVRVTGAPTGAAPARAAAGEGGGGAPKGAPAKGAVTAEAHLMVKVAPSAKAGAHGFRIFNPMGISNFVPVVVASGASIQESQPGGTEDHPQLIPIPALVSGRIAKNGEVDYYESEVAAPQTLQFEAITSGGFFRTTPATFIDPQVTVYQRGGSWFNGARLQRVEMDDRSFLFYNPPTNNTITFRRPRFTHKFPQAGKYLVAVRSAAGAGGPDAAYLLRVTTVDPASERTLDRWLPYRPACQDPGNWDERAFERELRPDRLQSLASRTVPAAGKKPSPPAAIPTIHAKETSRSQEEAMQLSVPALVDGVIAKPGDTDLFRIKVQAGEKLAFEIEAPELQPPYFCPWLRVFDAKGQKLADNIYRKIGGDGDDWIKSIEPKTLVTFDKEGDYYVQVRDLTQRDAGPLYRYRLLVRPQMAHVGEVSAQNFNQNGNESPEERLNLAPGDIRRLIVLTGLEEGYDGEVALTVENLPPGVDVLAAAAPFREVPAFPGEIRDKLGAVDKERYRPVRLATTLVLAVRADAPPTPEPRMIRLIARPVVKASMGRPIAGPRIAFMVVPGGKKPAREVQ